MCKLKKKCTVRATETKVHSECVCVCVYNIEVA